MNSMFDDDRCTSVGRPESSPRASSLSLDDLVVAERFLHRESSIDPVHAHAISKAIYAAGPRRYPTLWALAERHIKSYEAPRLDALSKLPTYERKD